MKSLIICAALFALAGPAASLAAPAGDDLATVKVGYADLNLGNAKDAALLLHRIDNAATEACGGWVSSNPIDLQIARESDCHRDAVRRTVAQIGSPVVSALYGHSMVLVANLR